MRFFSILLLLFTTQFSTSEEASSDELLVSTPEQIATLSNGPSFLIKGLVSPSSGQLSLKQTDLIVKGAQSITLDRIYLPTHIPQRFSDQTEKWEKYYLYRHLKNNYKDWLFFSHTHLNATRGTSTVRLSLSNGITLDYNVTGPNTTLTSKSYGITNTQGDIPGGQFDLRNTKITLPDDKKTIIVDTADGIKRIYRSTSYLHSEPPNYKFSTPTTFFLEKEILPSGKVIKYQFELNKLSYIESLNPKETCVYASIRIKPNKDNTLRQFLSSSGDNVYYYYEKRPLDVKVKGRLNGIKSRRSMSGDFPPILNKVTSPFFKNEVLKSSDKLFLFDHDRKLNPYKCEYDVFGTDEDRHYRLKILSFPEGKEDAFQSSCQMDYIPVVADKKAGKTTVKNADGSKVIYHFNEKYLTKAIETYDKNGELKLQKKIHLDS